MAQVNVKDIYFQAQVITKGRVGNSNTLRNCAVCQVSGFDKSSNIQKDLVTNDFEVLGFKGFEGISEVSEYEIIVSIENKYLYVDYILQSMGVLSVKYEEDGVLKEERIIGDIVEYTDLGAYDPSDVRPESDRALLYQLKLRTRLGRLCGRKSTRVFVNRNIQEIISEVFYSSAQLKELSISYVIGRDDGRGGRIRSSSEDIISIHNTDLIPYLDETGQEQQYIEYFDSGAYLIGQIGEEYVDLSKVFGVGKNKYRYPFVLQYEEDDFNFVKRILSREGYYMYHRQIAVDMPIGYCERNNKIYNDAWLIGTPLLVDTTSYRKIYLDVLVISRTFTEEQKVVDTSFSNNDFAFSNMSDYYISDNANILNIRHKRDYEGIGDVLINAPVQKTQRETGQPGYFHDTHQLIDIVKKGEIEKNNITVDEGNNVVVSDIEHKEEGNKIILEGGYYFNTRELPTDEGYKPRREVISRVIKAYDYSSENKILVYALHPGLFLHKVSGLDIGTLTERRVVGRIIKSGQNPRYRQYITNELGNRLYGAHKIYVSSRNYLSEIELWRYKNNSGEEKQYYSIPEANPESPPSLFGVIVNPKYDITLLPETEYKEDGSNAFTGRTRGVTEVFLDENSLSGELGVNYHDYPLLLNEGSYCVRLNISSNSFVLMSDYRERSSLPMSALSPIGSVALIGKETDLGEDPSYKEIIEEDSIRRSVMPYRVGTQVEVGFKLGDMDMPVILGAMNDINMDYLWDAEGNAIDLYRKKALVKTPIFGGTGSSEDDVEIIEEDELEFEEVEEDILDDDESFLGEDILDALIRIKDVTVDVGSDDYKKMYMSLYHESSPELKTRIKKNSVVLMEMYRYGKLGISPNRSIYPTESNRFQRIFSLKPQIEWGTGPTEENVIEIKDDVKHLYGYDWYRYESFEPSAIEDEHRGFHAIKMPNTRPEDQIVLEGGLYFSDKLSQEHIYIGSYQLLTSLNMGRNIWYVSDSTESIEGNTNVEYMREQTRGQLTEQYYGGYQKISMTRQAYEALNNYREENRLDYKEVVSEREMLLTSNDIWMFGTFRDRDRNEEILHPYSPYHFNDNPPVNIPISELYGELSGYYITDRLIGHRQTYTGGNPYWTYTRGKNYHFGIQYREHMVHDVPSYSFMTQVDFYFSEFFVNQQFQEYIFIDLHGVDQDNPSRNRDQKHASADTYEISQRKYGAIYNAMKVMKIYNKSDHDNGVLSSLEEVKKVHERKIGLLLLKYMSSERTMEGGVIDCTRNSTNTTMSKGLFQKIFGDKGFDYRKGNKNEGKTNANYGNLAKGKLTPDDQSTKPIPISLSQSERKRANNQKYRGLVGGYEPRIKIKSGGFETEDNVGEAPVNGAMSLWSKMRYSPLSIGSGTKMARAEAISSTGGAVTTGSSSATEGYFEVLGESEKRVDNTHVDYYRLSGWNVADARLEKEGQEYTLPKSLYTNILDVEASNTGYRSESAGVYRMIVEALKGVGEFDLTRMDLVKLYSNKEDLLGYSGTSGTGGQETPIGQNNYEQKWTAEDNLIRALLRPVYKLGSSAVMSSYSTTEGPAEIKESDSKFVSLSELLGNNFPYIELMATNISVIPCSPAGTDIMDLINSYRGGVPDLGIGTADIEGSSTEIIDKDLDIDKAISVVKSLTVSSTITIYDNSKITDFMGRMLTQTLLDENNIFYDIVEEIKKKYKEKAEEAIKASDNGSNYPQGWFSRNFESSKEIYDSSRVELSINDEVNGTKTSPLSKIRVIIETYSKALAEDLKKIRKLFTETEVTNTQANTDVNKETEGTATDMSPAYEGFYFYSEEFNRFLTTRSEFEEKEGEWTVKNNVKGLYTETLEAYLRQFKTVASYEIGLDDVAVAQEIYSLDNVMSPSHKQEFISNLNQLIEVQTSFINSVEQIDIANLYRGIVVDGGAYSKGKHVRFISGNSYENYIGESSKIHSGDLKITQLDILKLIDEDTSDGTQDELTEIEREILYNNKVGYEGYENNFNFGTLRLWTTDILLLTHGNVEAWSNLKCSLYFGLDMHWALDKAQMTTTINSSLNASSLTDEENHKLKKDTITSLKGSGAGVISRTTVAATIAAPMGDQNFAGGVILKITGLDSGIYDEFFTLSVGLTITAAPGAYSISNIRNRTKYVASEVMKAELSAVDTTSAESSASLEMIRANIATQTATVSDASVAPPPPPPVPPGPSAGTRAAGLVTSTATDGARHGARRGSDATQAKKSSILDPAHDIVGKGDHTLAEKIKRKFGWSKYKHDASGFVHSRAIIRDIDTSSLGMSLEVQDAFEVTFAQSLDKVNINGCLDYNTYVSAVKSQFKQDVLDNATDETAKLVNHIAPDSRVGKLGGGKAHIPDESAFDPLMDAIDDTFTKNKDTLEDVFDRYRVATNTRMNELNKDVADRFANSWRSVGGSAADAHKARRAEEMMGRFSRIKMKIEGTPLEDGKYVGAHEDDIKIVEEDADDVGYNVNVLASPFEGPKALDTKYKLINPNEAMVAKLAGYPEVRSAQTLGEIDEFKSADRAKKREAMDEVDGAESKESLKIKELEDTREEFDKIKETYQKMLNDIEKRKESVAKLFSIKKHILENPADPVVLTPELKLYAKDLDIDKHFDMTSPEFKSRENHLDFMDRITEQEKQYTDSKRLELKATEDELDVAMQNIKKLNKELDDMSNNPDVDYWDIDIEFRKVDSIGSKREIFERYIRFHLAGGGHTAVNINSGVTDFCPEGMTGVPVFLVIDSKGEKRGNPPKYPVKVHLLDENDVLQVMDDDWDNVFNAGDFNAHRIPIGDIETLDFDVIYDPTKTDELEDMRIYTDQEADDIHAVEVLFLHNKAKARKDYLYQLSNLETEYQKARESYHTLLDDQKAADAKYQSDLAKYNQDKKDYDDWEAEKIRLEAQNEQLKKIKEDVVAAQAKYLQDKADYDQRKKAAYDQYKKDLEDAESKAREQKQAAIDASHKSKSAQDFPANLSSYDVAKTRKAGLKTEAPILDYTGTQMTLKTNPASYDALVQTSGNKLTDFKGTTGDVVAIFDTSNTKDIYKKIGDYEAISSTKLPQMEEALDNVEDLVKVSLEHNAVRQVELTHEINKKTEELELAVAEYEAAQNLHMSLPDEPQHAQAAVDAHDKLDKLTKEQSALVSERTEVYTNIFYARVLSTNIIEQSKSVKNAFDKLEEAKEVVYKLEHLKEQLATTVSRGDKAGDVASARIVDVERQLDIAKGDIDAIAKELDSSTQRLQEMRDELVEVTNDIDTKNTTKKRDPSNPTKTTPTPKADSAKFANDFEPGLANLRRELTTIEFNIGEEVNRLASLNNKLNRGVAAKRALEIGEMPDFRDLIQVENPNRAIQVDIGNLYGGLQGHENLSEAGLALNHLVDQFKATNESLEALKEAENAYRADASKLQEYKDAYTAFSQEQGRYIGMKTNYQGIFARMDQVDDYLNRTEVSRFSAVVDDAAGDSRVVQVKKASVEIKELEIDPDIDGLEFVSKADVRSIAAKSIANHHTFETVNLISAKLGFNKTQKADQLIMDYTSEHVGDTKGKPWGSHGLAGNKSAGKHGNFLSEAAIARQMKMNARANQVAITSDAIVGQKGSVHGLNSIPHRSNTQIQRKFLTAQKEFDKFIQTYQKQLKGVNFAQEYKSVRSKISQMEAVHNSTIVEVDMLKFDIENEGRREIAWAHKTEHSISELAYLPSKDIIKKYQQNPEEVRRYNSKVADLCKKVLKKRKTIKTETDQMQSLQNKLKKMEDGIPVDGMSKSRALTLKANIHELLDLEVKKQKLADELNKNTSGYTGAVNQNFLDKEGLPGPSQIVAQLASPERKGYHDKLSPMIKKSAFTMMEVIQKHQQDLYFDCIRGAKFDSDKMGKALKDKLTEVTPAELERLYPDVVSKHKTGGVLDTDGVVDELVRTALSNKDEVKYRHLRKKHLMLYSGGSVLDEVHPITAKYLGHEVQNYMDLGTGSFDRALYQMRSNQMLDDFLKTSGDLKKEGVSYNRDIHLYARMEKEVFHSSNDNILQNQHSYFLELIRYKAHLMEANEVGEANLAFKRADELEKNIKGGPGIDDIKVDIKVVNAVEVETNAAVVTKTKTNLAHHAMQYSSDVPNLRVIPNSSQVEAGFQSSKTNPNILDDTFSMRADYKAYITDKGIPAPGETYDTTKIKKAVGKPANAKMVSEDAIRAAGMEAFSRHSTSIGWTVAGEQKQIKTVKEKIKKLSNKVEQEEALKFNPRAVNTFGIPKVDGSGNPGFRVVTSGDELRRLVGKLGGNEFGVVISRDLTKEQRAINDFIATGGPSTSTGNPLPIRKIDKKDFDNLPGKIIADNSEIDGLKDEALRKGVRTKVNVDIDQYKKMDLSELIKRSTTGETSELLVLSDAVPDVRIPDGAKDHNIKIGDPTAGIIAARGDTVAKAHDTAAMGRELRKMSDDDLKAIVLKNSPNSITDTEALQRVSVFKRDYDKLARDFEQSRITIGAFQTELKDKLEAHALYTDSQRVRTLVTPIQDLNDATAVFANTKLMEDVLKNQNPIAHRTIKKLDQYRKDVTITPRTANVNVTINQRKFDFNDPIPKAPDSVDGGPAIIPPAPPKPVKPTSPTLPPSKAPDALTYKDLGNLLKVEINPTTAGLSPRVIVKSYKSRKKLKRRIVASIPFLIDITKVVSRLSKIINRSLFPIGSIPIFDSSTLVPSESPELAEPENELEEPPSGGSQPIISPEIVEDPDDREQVPDRVEDYNPLDEDDIPSQPPVNPPPVNPDSDSQEDVEASAEDSSGDTIAEVEDENTPSDEIQESNGGSGIGSSTEEENTPVGDDSNTIEGNTESDNGDQTREVADDALRAQGGGENSVGRDTSSPSEQSNRETSSSNTREAVAGGVAAAATAAKISGSDIPNGIASANTNSGAIPGGSSSGSEYVAVNDRDDESSNADQETSDTLAEGATQTDTNVETTDKVSGRQSVSEPDVKASDTAYATQTIDAEEIGSETLASREGFAATTSGISDGKIQGDDSLIDILKGAISDAKEQLGLGSESNNVASEVADMDLSSGNQDKAARASSSFKSTTDGSVVNQEGQVNINSSDSTIKSTNGNSSNGNGKSSASDWIKNQQTKSMDASFKKSANLSSADLNDWLSDAIEENKNIKK